MGRQEVLDLLDYRKSLRASYLWGKEITQAKSVSGDLDKIRIEESDTVQDMSRNDSQSYILGHIKDKGV